MVDYIMQRSDKKLVDRYPPTGFGGQAAMARGVDGDAW